METDLIIAHHSSDGILAAAERHKAGLLVMGWKGYTDARDRIFGEIADQVIRFAPCDLMLLKIGDKKDIKNCLLPTAGGPNAQLASQILDAMTKYKKISVTAGYVVSEQAGEEEKEKGVQAMDRTLSDLTHAAGMDKKFIESQSIAGGIAKASREFDLVVIGAAKEPFFRQMLFGEIPEKVARYSPTSVLLVKKYEGIVKSILKKVLG
ncbi:MAG: universal stress protein [Calditrichaceae bacterium]